MKHLVSRRMCFLLLSILVEAIVEERGANNWCEDKSGYTYGITHTRQTFNHSKKRRKRRKVREQQQKTGKDSRQWMTHCHLSSRLKQTLKRE